MVTIAIDVMGGDIGPAAIIPAALTVASNQIRLILVGQEDLLRETLQTHNALHHPAIVVRHAAQTVTMHESPSQALRQKKNSSMRVAINLVKQGEADACVSAGNTGALMATAKFVLKTLPGIHRPAICTSLPSVHGHVHVLDLGANVDSKAEHLLQFAVMGSVLATAVDNIEQPRVGLLNIGEEDMKGNEQVKNAAKLLINSAVNYIGFVEGDGVFFDQVDVVVCDGFVGNVALKQTEGIARLIRQFMHQEFKRNLWTRLSGLIAKPVLDALGRRIDPRRYNGGSLLGLQGIVIKSHGSADSVAFANALRIAAVEVQKAVPQRIAKYLNQSQLERQVL